LDGDTVVLLDSTNTRIHIRLDGIDAPENSQSYGKESADKLKELILDKDVKILSSGKDKYGRTIGRIYINDAWINLEMIKLGCAWHYKQYSKDEKLANAELVARSEKLGIWSESNPIAPWDYRHLGIQTTKPSTDTKITVYITRAGRSYHKLDCRYLGRRPKAITLEYAKIKYVPCSVCKPPK
jgi:endonuclease YncB( thermonuclease family)